MYIITVVSTNGDRIRYTSNSYPEYTLSDADDYYAINVGEENSPPFGFLHIIESDYGADTFINLENTFSYSIRELNDQVTLKEFQESITK